MFEFHGWASIQHHTKEVDSYQQERCWLALIEHVKALSVTRELIHLQRYNGCDSLHVAGQHNHRSDYVFELFHWVAENAPGSYGILYIRDDEDFNRDGDYSNCFRVWKLCRGQLVEQPDPFLSPAIPTVEDP